ncbi:MAG: hypothetical protein KAI81_03695, partial [Candidatus Marinimicrobia bacterium]|nr:hypothetical protein [Candidatus Neomarinimicrobiota bacterium]
TSVFFDTEWQDQYNSIYRITENGSPQQISIQFPSGDRDLACGYQYVWQVEAREFLDDATTSIFNMSGFSGVWGWPEPTKSSIYTFNFGSRLTKDNVTSPTEGSQVNSVLPSFNWESVSCASEYELWLSDAIDDPDVENPFYQSEPIQSLPFQYPFDAPGLMPGKRYTWKVRYNPNGEISPWSEIISFTASESELTEPAQGDMITTVLPLFNADLPNDVAAIELRIGDIEDENVEMANIYSEIITGLPFQYPRDAAIGLFPGQKYFWKMIILDANDNMVGLPDEYQNIGNFTISAMNYLTPDQNEMEVVLQPIFSWESPNEVASFELAISDENDPDVQNPSIIFNVTGSFYQYPVDAEIQLEHSKDYYWTLKAQDENGNLSDPLAPRKFRTQEKPLQAAPELQVNGLTEKCPCEDNLEFTIMWTPVAESEYYHFIISESREIGEDKLLSERIFEVEDLSLTSIQLSYEDYAFEYGLPYYIQVIATKEEEFHSYPSEILNINYCQLKDMDSKPEFRIEAGISEPRLLNIYLDTELECASSYSLKLSSEPDMSTSLLESGELQNFPYSWEACIDNLEFSTNYYVQMQGLIDGDAHGQLSDIMTVSIKEEPGSVDIPEVSVTLSADRPICPLVNYNQVVNAQSSRIIISTESETNDEGILTAQLFSIGEIRQTNINLCDLDIVLEYTQQYYLQVQGENEGESFGLASEIVSFTTLNQPGASDKFEFALTTSTVDPCTYQINLLNGVSGSDNYYIEFSESSEIDNIVLTLNIQNFPAEFTVDGIELLWDTPYFVRGQAIQNDLSHG